jgi:hypothetical protein
MGGREQSERRTFFSVGAAALASFSFFDFLDEAGASEEGARAGASLALGVLFGLEAAAAAVEAGFDFLAGGGEATLGGGAGAGEERGEGNGGLDAPEADG